MTNQVEFFVKMREPLHSLRHASHHSLFVCNNVLLSRIAYVVFVATWMRPPITLLQSVFTSQSISSDDIKSIVNVPSL